MAKTISNRVLIRAADVDMSTLTGNIESLKEVADLGTRLWVIEKQPYEIDFKKFVSTVATIGDKLKKGTDITVADIRALPPIVTEKPAVQDEENKTPIPRHHFYSPMLIHSSRDWPVKGVVPGAIVVMGDTGSGKTTHVFKKLDPDVVLRYSEPQEDVDGLDMVCPVSSLTGVLTASMVLSALGFRVAVDSLRGLVYGLSGNAMEGGAVASLFDVMVQFNNLFADVGISVILVVNPMLADMSKADRLFLRLEAVVAGGIYVHERAVKTASFRCEDGRVRNVSMTDPESSETGRRDPANTDLRAGGYTTMYNMERLKEDGSRDRLAAALGAQATPSTEDKPRPSAHFTL